MVQIGIMIGFMMTYVYALYDLRHALEHDETSCGETGEYTLGLRWLRLGVMLAYVCALYIFMHTLECTVDGKNIGASARGAAAPRTPPIYRRMGCLCWALYEYFVSGFMRRFYPV